VAFEALFQAKHEIAHLLGVGHADAADVHKHGTAGAVVSRKLIDVSVDLRRKSDDP